METVLSSTAIGIIDFMKYAVFASVLVVWAGWILIVSQLGSDNPPGRVKRSKLLEIIRAIPGWSRLDTDPSSPRLAAVAPLSKTTAQPDAKDKPSDSAPPFHTPHAA